MLAERFSLALEVAEEVKKGKEEEGNIEERKLDVGETNSKKLAKGENENSQDEDEVEERCHSLERTKKE